MSLSEVCIKRPVFSWVMTLVLILLGIVGYSRLHLLHKPAVDVPYVTIESHLNGAAPEVVEAQVTRVIEEAISGIEGIQHFESTSSPETSKISIEFMPTRRIDDAVNDVRDRLAKIQNQLPHEMEAPTLTRSKNDDRPIMTIALTSDKTEPSELQDFAKNDIEKELEAIDGVSNVEVVGGGLYKMRLKLDPVKMSGYGITVTEVIQAIRQQNVEKPAGKLISKDREYLVTTVAGSETPEEFAQLPIANKDGTLIMLKDIGKAEMSTMDTKTKTYFNGKLGVSISVFKQSTANPVDVARRLRAAMPKIQEHIPDDMTLRIGSDTARFIEDALNRIQQTLFEAFIFVTLVVFLFLRSARASVIPLVTIPISLIATFFVMYLLNFSINTLTLMAMVLAIGLVVDDAIVVLENIYRRIEQGEKPLIAAVRGMREITFAVIAMTLTLAAVYTPFALITGTVGKTFTEYAITLAVAVIFSGFAALTLSPMMCSRLLGHDEDTIGSKSANWWTSFKNKIRTDIWLDKSEVLYRDYLAKAIDKPKNLLITTAIFCALGIAAFFSLPREFFPYEDQGKIYIDGQSSPSSTLEFTDRYVKQIDDILAQIPEVVRRVVNIKNPTYDIVVELDRSRGRSTQQVVEEIRKKLEIVPGVSVKFGSMGGAAETNNTVQFIVGANKTIKEIKGYAEVMKDNLYANPDIVQYILSTPLPDTEEYKLTIRRNKASSLGVDPGAIADTIDALVRGRKAGTFKRQNRLYDVMVEVIDEARQTPNDITNLFMKANDKKGTLVPISELIDVNSATGSSQIFRYNKNRSVSMTAVLNRGIGLTEGIGLVSQIRKNDLPKDVRVEFIGETRKYIDESQSILLIVGLALAFIYLVLAAQFESWVDPFIILLSVPLSVAGGLITLALVQDGTLNVYSQIGLVTLIGLITKHGILIVDFTNKLRDDGQSKVEALIHACELRLRPILMTTFAMVLGAVPLALATGAGSESIRQIGFVIVGGMSFGTIFTLFILPLVYLIISPNKRKIISIAEA
ncbi:MAG: efflux RND transporter permease subunit [Candidatus Paracaedibacteraceae bacterium]|nr:efflux RND transporter permease subunit [Candidatus Paracaedibacteraceae bacterium]